MALFVLVPAVPAFAAETVSSDTVLIREDVVVDEDLYASGLEIIIDGELQGDLIAVAGEQLVINGVVEGSVTAIAQEVIIRGEVVGSLRSVSSHTVVEGIVGKDLVATGVRADVAPEGGVEGDAILWTWNATVEGTIGGDLEGIQRNLDLAGAVEGNVDVTVRRLTVIDELTVGGDLTYRSDREAAGLENVEVGGVIVMETPLPSNIRVRALGLFGRVLTILFLAGVAMLIAMFWPERAETAGSRLKESPIRAYLYGLAALATPVVLVGLGVLALNLAPASASLPLIAVIIPIALGLFVLVGLIAILSITPAVLVLGRMLRRNADIYRAVAYGSGVVGLLWIIPWVGWLVPLVVMPAGVGAWALSGGSDSPEVTGSPSS